MCWTCLESLGLGWFWFERWTQEWRELGSKLVSGISPLRRNLKQGQACPYYAKTNSALMGEALGWLAEGMVISVLVREFGYREETLAQWFNRAGDHGAQFHTQTFLDLNFVSFRWISSMPG